MKREAAARLRILLLEDNPADAELVLYELKRAGIDADTVRVITREDFEAQLEPCPDAILSDFQLPSWTGLQALQLVRERGLEVPFIIVSGTIGEDVAVETMRHGADDYLLKDRLSRLGTALTQALDRKRLRGETRKAAAALQASLQRFRAIFENAAVGIAHSDLDGRFVMINPQFREIIGYAKEDARSLTFLDLTHPDDVRRSIEARAGLVAGTAKHYAREARLFRRDGSQFWAHITTSMVHDADGKPLHFISVLHDISERKAQQERIARLTRVYAVLSGINALIVRVRDREELYRESCRIAVEAGQFRSSWFGLVDRKAMRIDPVCSTGSTPEYMALIKDRFTLAEDTPMGNSLSARAVRECRIVFSNDTQNDPGILLKKVHLESGTRSIAILPLQVGGEVVAVLALYAAETGFFDADELKLLRELAGDISFALDNLEKATRLNYLAYYDSLTGLANRELFGDRVNQLTRAAGPAGTKLAVAMFDIERLRTVNESLGRQAGDELLSQVAARLEGAAGAAAVGRASADHFTVVLGPLEGSSEAGRRVEAITRACFEAPFQAGDSPLRLSAKAGIALFPADGSDAETLLGNAEAALRKAKALGERQVFYSADMTERTAQNLTLENKLREALEREEFVLHYQPKVDLATRGIVGVEALIRWQSPELGLVPPMKFIPLMEETGLILEVGSWALRRAAADHRGWVEQRLQAPRIAVNVSAIQLRQAGFVGAVEQAIIEGIAPTGIDLEITESLVMDDVLGNIEKLKAVRGLGVSIAIDDFGTGYSSLAYLAKLPVQALKIDRSFIITMLDDPDTMTLVQTMISLAHSLKLTVVAEGVDAEEQAKMLRLLRCDEMQGYLISKPLPIEDITAMLRKES